METTEKKMKTKEQILTEHTQYGNPHSRQDWIEDIRNFYLARHILSAMEEYASERTKGLERENGRLKADVFRLNGELHITKINQALADRQINGDVPGLTVVDPEASYCQKCNWQLQDGICPHCYPDKDNPDAVLLKMV